MVTFITYRKFVTLKNGKRMMLRFLTEEDRQGLIQLFQEAPVEDTRFLKENVKDMNMVHHWMDHLDYGKVLPLLAVDLENKNQIVADATLHLGKHTSRHIGEIHMYVSPFYRGLGLGSLMVEELTHLALIENLQWLKAEIIADHKNVIKAFRAQGFEPKALLDEYFLRLDGVAHDVVLMMRRVVKKEEAEF